ncbi:MAG: hypothetical protein MdMp014T_1836 [Treponematales bacterium]
MSITCLLFGGARDTGKTGAVHRVKDYLVKSRGFRILASDLTHAPDFCALLEGQSNAKKTIRVGLIGGTDSAAKMRRAADFFAKQKPQHGSPDFWVSTIRDDFQLPKDPKNERVMFENILGVLVGKDRMEIPLGKVRGGSGRPAASIWYAAKIDLLAQAFLP